MWLFGTSFDFKDTSFIDALNVVANAHNESKDSKAKPLAIFVASDVNSEAKINLTLTGLTTKQVLQFVCSQANCIAVIKENYVFVIEVGLVAGYEEPNLPEIKICPR